MPDVTDTDVRAVAARHGIELDDAAVEAFREATAEQAAQYAAFPSSLSTADPPTSLSPGTDPYNAFRYEFELEGESGPLSGLDVAVKENVVVAGVPTTCGSPGFEYEPDFHATVVDRLLGAGASLVGTTNMDEFAFFTTGETCAHGRIENPVVEGCVPGGSSSGSGAAVAADVVDAALGTDTGGSVRIPASFCGVVGVKPTHQTVSRFGVVDLSQSLDHVGPLARDVETAARVLEAIAGPDANDPSTRGSPDAGAYTEVLDDGVEDLRLGVVTEAMDSAEPEVAPAVESDLDRLRDAGATVEETSIEGYELASAAVGAIAGLEFASFVSTNGAAYATGTGTTEPLRAAVAAANERGEFGENVVQMLLTNGVLVDGDGSEYVAAKGVQRTFTRTVCDALETYDALVTPTTPMAAPAFGEITGVEGLLRTVENTAPFNCSGHPAVSVPSGAADDKPVGVQAVTRWNDEATALRVARAVERR
ncbi:aspartyl-tRNA(Asn)/glutamyl-tRNA(Gln) amidotransferase subunit A [Halogranum amylolyticum]|uniref:Aspartyl-tRNA(Asn)/glutamyl-tRNA(Gln) amidotransferase subunit A n=1 Tax=Halogranum amylolyticum TaxID=660520 RepID=A0A1H8MUG9_9EURY|nr:amidase family protein [Halogranum amylolyticum]SEO20894.1 aspartyl-tRNA(Asn)/glutamyl-tRNA(Gln) amidotransferase subunit A [Halogranum amylolyticum]